MTIRRLAATLAIACIAAIVTPAAVDTLKIGPQIGAVVPPIEGLDQFGRKQTLSTVAGTRGTMLVFFRSADW